MTLASDRITWAHKKLATLFSRIGKTAWSVMFLLVGLGHGCDAQESLSGWVGLLGIIMAAAFILSFSAWLSRPSGEGQLTIVDDNTLVIRRGRATKSIALRSITGAWLLPGRFPAVEIEIDGKDVATVTTLDEGLAKAFIERLGFGPKGRRIRIDFARPSRRFLNIGLGLLWYILAMVIVLAVVIPVGALTGLRLDNGLQFIAVGPLAIALYTLVAPGLRTLEAAIGTDGVEIRNGSSRRFISRRDIAAVLRRQRDAPLVLRSHDGSTLPIASFASSPEKLEAIGLAIEERLMVNSPVPDKTPFFERGGRQLKSWRDELGRALQDPGYRSAGATTEDARAVLESSLATGEQRVGAALALAVSGEKERVRVAAEATIDPRVRVVLEAIADDDEVEVEKALQRLRQ